MDARALEGIEEIAGQTSARPTRRGIFGFSVSPSLARASVVREQKKASKKKAAIPVTVKSPPSPGQPAAVGKSFTCYSTLVETCRARCDELELSRAELDRLSGLPEGYSAKLLGRDGCGPRRKRAWPISLEALLGTLGLKVILIVDETAEARTLARREKPVDRSQQRFGNVSRLTPKLLASSAPQPASPPILTAISGKRRGSKYG
jgi:hypothetical protein